MLVIFPFEKEFYNSHGIEAEFIGHPLIGTLNLDLSKEECQKHLGITSSPVIGLLPGSRRGEIEKIMPILIETAKILQEKIPEAKFILPIASIELRPLIEDQLKQTSVKIRTREGSGKEIIVASDLLILASGTVTLEASVYLTPMIIVYKISFFSWLMGKILIKIPFIGLVNIVRGQKSSQSSSSTRPARGSGPGWIRNINSTGDQRTDDRGTEDSQRQTRPPRRPPPAPRPLSQIAYNQHLLLSHTHNFTRYF